MSYLDDYHDPFFGCNRADGKTRDKRTPRTFYMYVFFTYTDCTWNRHREARRTEGVCIDWYGWIGFHDMRSGLARNPYKNLLCSKNLVVSVDPPFKGHWARQSTKNVQGTFFHGGLKGTPPNATPQHSLHEHWEGYRGTHKFQWIFITLTHKNQSGVNGILLVC